MRVKEWSNTAILRVIRNEKYCGDLVQEKTFVPDFYLMKRSTSEGKRNI